MCCWPLGPVGTLVGTNYTLYTFIGLVHIAGGKIFKEIGAGRTDRQEPETLTWLISLLEEYRIQLVDRILADFIFRCKLQVNLCSVIICMAEHYP